MLYTSTLYSCTVLQNANINLNNPWLTHQAHGDTITKPGLVSGDDYSTYIYNPKRHKMHYNKGKKKGENRPVFILRFWKAGAPGHFLICKGHHPTIWGNCKILLSKHFKGTKAMTIGRPWRQSPALPPWFVSGLRTRIYISSWEILWLVHIQWWA